MKKMIFIFFWVLSCARFSNDQLAKLALIQLFEPLSGITVNQPSFLSILRSLHLQ